MLRILLLESDKILAENLKSFFRRAGHKLDWRVEPQAAIDSADKSSPDLVIMDLLLAERSGVEFLYEFRSYPEWQAVPVIIFSSIPADEFNSNTSFAELGIFAYHYKPHTSLKDLAESVATAIPIPV